ncbi:MAG: NlpC/P60 family protein [Ferruginibacter sp.]
MKHLFFVAFAGGIFSTTTISVIAQTNVNIERLADRPEPKNSPKFIEAIEILPGAISSTIVLTNEQPAVIKEVAIASGTNGIYSSTIELSNSIQFKYATMMDREVESITNIRLYNFIEEWWATRYVYGGADRNGIDCSAFTGKLLSEVYGLNVPRMAKDQYKVCEKLTMEALVEGDLVFFDRKGGISHVGLYLGDNYFVHSSVHDGVTISSLTDEYYSKKFISGGRVVIQ